MNYKSKNTSRKIKRCIGLVVVLALGTALLSGCEQMPQSASRASGKTSGATLGPSNDPNPGPGLQLAANPKHVVPIHRTNAQWHKVLSSHQYYILRDKGTEPPFHNPYDEYWKPGTYACAACGLALFSSKAKYEPKTGWPSFYKPIAKNRVKLVSEGGGVYEVECARCGSHIGELFQDGPPSKGGVRYCLDSASLRFKPAADAKKHKGPYKPGIVYPAE